jgi:putative ABC transport system substrate-binding protein
MRRRDFLAGIGALLAPSMARAQTSGAMRRIAILELGGHRMLDDQWRILLARLRELGYEEGRNLAIDRGNADGVEARLPQIARELLSKQPEVVLVTSTPATQVLKSLTQTVPIVITGTADPVATGLVASLARPGGNITGVSLQLNDIAVKRIELMRELMPQMRRIGMLGPASNTGVQAVFKRAREAVQGQGIDLRIIDAVDAPAITRAFDTLATERIDALLITQILFVHHKQIVELAAKHRIPAAFVDREILEAGGLLVLGPSREGLYRHAADYVHRILQGAKPAELPVIQPTEFWLGLNLRTARALGVKVPQSLLLRADRVIE